MSKINCEQAEVFINENIDGEISGRNKTLLIEHLSECGGCKRVMEETKSIIDAASSLPKETASEKDLWNGIEKQILIEKKRFGLEKPKSGWRKHSYYYYSIAAVLVLAAIVVLFRYVDFKPNTDTKGPVYLDIGQFWKITDVEGTPKVESVSNPEGKEVSGTDSMKIGEWLVTDSVSKAVINVSNIGRVKLGPKSKVKLIKSAAGDHRIMLEYGTIDANINAEPRSFFVETKSVTAVDLGCEYTMSSDENGDGAVYVKSGRVSLESPGRATLVPAGQMCLTKEGIGPGTPYRADASEELKRALINFDFQRCESECVSKVIQNAGKKDYVTLINMISRVDSSKKIIIIEKLDKYAKTPHRISKDSIYKYDKEYWDKWSEEFEKDLHENLKKNLEHLDRDIHIHIEKNMELLDEQLKNMEIEIKTETDKYDKYKFNYKYYYDNEYGPKVYEFNDSIPFDEEKFKKDMEEMHKELQKMNKELQLDQEEIQKIVLERVKDMKIEIKINKEELKKEIQKEIEAHKDEIKKHKEELNKDIEKENEKKEIEKEKEE